MKKSESVVLNVLNVSLSFRKLHYACKGSFMLSESERESDFSVIVVAAEYEH